MFFNQQVKEFTKQKIGLIINRSKLFLLNWRFYLHSFNDRSLATS